VDYLIRIFVPARPVGKASVVASPRDAPRAGYSLA
jgi:hypothetical protein